MDSMAEAAIAELKAARVRRGLSQAEVAQRIGTTQSAVARLETAQSDPRLSTLQRYADAVGADVVVVSSVAPSIMQVAVEMRSALDADEPEDALRLVVQFLDDLGKLSSEQQFWALRDEPASTGDRRWDALLAGVVEYASRIHQCSVPGWTAAPSRFLRRFWFVVEDILGRPAPGLAASAFVSSPPALASRGVFLDSASLVSV